MFSSLLMAVATYVRSETLLLAGFLCLAIFGYSMRKHSGIYKALLLSAGFMVPCTLTYLLSVTIYLNYYVPVPYPVADLVNPDLANLVPLFRRFSDMNSLLIFSESGLSYYGYFIYLFILLAVTDLLYAKWLTATARNWLFAILVIYLGVPFLGYVLPLMDLFNTTKRALFKLFPLLLLYLANTRLLMEISGKIDAWEMAQLPVLKKDLR